MSELKDIRQERSNTYGKFSDHAIAVENIMKEMENLKNKANSEWEHGFKTAMFYMVGKFTRLAVTNSHEDSLIDLANYALLWKDIVCASDFKFSEPGTLKTMEEYDTHAKVLIKQNRKDNPYYNDLRRLLAKEFETFKDEYKSIFKGPLVEFNPNYSTKVIDLGCGDGAYIKSLSSIFKDCLAIDKSPIRLQDKTIYTKQCNIFKNKCEEVKSPAHMILMNEFLHVLSKSQIKQVLSMIKAQYLVIGENDPHLKVNYDLDFRLNYLSNGKLYRRDEIISMLEEASYEVISIKEISPRYFIIAKRK